MFTGIIEELGVVKRLTRSKGGFTQLLVEAPRAVRGVGIGDSIAVNGVCLTVVAFSGSVLSFDIMEETMKTTVLGSLRPGEKVNCERSLAANGRLSGHFVTGHVDCTGAIRRKIREGAKISFEIGIPPEQAVYCLPKGSIAVDGISLTIADLVPGGFSVCIIPHTLKHTTLDFKHTSDKVNIEFDVLAKAAVRAAAGSK